MFGRKKAEEKPARDRKSRGNLPLLGYDVDVGDEDDGDADLERELSALVGGGGGRAGGRGKPKKPQVSQSQLNAMVADCMKDFEDEDMSDTDDPDLLAELEEFEDDSGGDGGGGGGGMELGVSHSYTETIRERLALYKEAEAVAVSNGDSGRARRFNRGVKTLQELERRAAGGLAVKEEDIPPVISVGKRVEQTSSSNTSSSASTPATEAPAPASQPPPPRGEPGGGSRAAGQDLSVMTGGQIAELEATREKYKRAALAAKTGGDRQAALEMMKLIKTCDNLLLEVRQGNVVDLALIRPSESQVCTVEIF